MNIEHRSKKWQIAEKKAQMIKSFNLIILCALCLMPYAFAQFTAISYNIQGMRPSTNWEQRVIAIVDELIELDAAIIGLQEVNETLDGNGEDNQAKIIAETLSEHFGTEYFWYRSISHIAWDEFYESVAIISKYPVEQFGVSTLATGVFPRKVVWANVDSPVGLINFFNTHLSYLPEHDNIRQIQVSQIKNFIEQKEASHPAMFSVLTGDFNCTQNSNPIRSLTENGYSDTFRELNPGVSGNTFPANSPYTRIDYIFQKDGSNWLANQSEVVFDTPYSGNNYPSDHRGVRTVFTGEPEVNFLMDGLLDESAQLIESNENINFYADWDGEDLYVASDAAIENDHFIFVSSGAVYSTNAPWNKTGQVSVWEAYLGNEESNNWCGWFDWQGESSSAVDSVLEGILPIVETLGVVPEFVYLSFGAYQTDDNGALQIQIPAGDDDGNIEIGEHFLFPLVVEEITLGDLNDDGAINVLDIVICVNIAIGEEPTEYQLTVCDLNNDGEINILDVVIIVNLALESGEL